MWAPLYPKQMARPAAVSRGLQRRAHAMAQVKEIKGLKVTNWSETFECQPESYFVPKNVEEIREILLLAKSNNKKVRVIGRSRSPSDIAFTSDYLVSLQYLNNFLSANPEKGQVKVEAGMTLVELNLHLDKHGLALPVMGSVADITIAGAMSTGTHGTGIKYQVISSYVKELQLLTCSGDLLTCSRQEKAETFFSALCGLGALGVLINVTLEVEPAFLLFRQNYPSTLDEVLDELDEHLESSDHFRFLWFPHTNNVSVSHSNRIYNKTITTYSRMETMVNWFWEYGVGYYTLELVYWVSSYIPSLVPLINRVAFALLYSKPTERVDRSYNIFTFECLFKQYVNEWSIPRESTQIVLLELRRLVESTPDLYVHFPVEVRFVKGDDIYLSPAFGRDSCYINIIAYRPYGKIIEYQGYWEAYEKIVREAGGRPHWAKAHNVTAIDFVKMYPYFRAWAQVRKRMDPINMFMNSYLNRIFATFPKE